MRWIVYLNTLSNIYIKSSIIIEIDYKETQIYKKVNKSIYLLIT